jgi:hypothetical protein
MDAYAGPERAKYIKNPLLHPILADIETLPRNMSIVGGKVDILLHEQTVFAKRLEEEAEAINQGAKSSINSKGETVDDLYHIESEFFDNQIHGWLERMIIRLFAVTDLVLTWICMLSSIDVH